MLAFQKVSQGGRNAVVPVSLRVIDLLLPVLGQIIVVTPVLLERGELALKLILTLGLRVELVVLNQPRDGLRAIKLDLGQALHVGRRLVAHADGLHLHRDGLLLRL